MQIHPKRFCAVLSLAVLLCAPGFVQGELLLPAEEVMTAYLAALEDDGFYALLDDDASLEADFEEEDFEALERMPDPLEPWNRFWFGFNDRFYFWVFKPVAKGYRSAVPLGARVGIRNVFHNLAMPVRFVSALLQAKPKIAGYEFSRFLVNTSVGLGGWFDVASRDPELKSYNEDLGQTFGVWGIGHGLYLVWPIIGPSSLRDTVGRVGDTFLNPVNYVTLATPTGTVYGIRAFEHTNEGSLRIGEYEDLKEAALDPYLALRNAYFQRRKAEVAK